LRLQKFFYVAMIAVGLAGGATYLASGPHKLAKPPSTRASTPPPEYDWSTPQEACSFSYVQPAVEEYLAELRPGARVLDLGCGNGAMLGSFLRKGWTLVGVDISKSGIEQARQYWPDAQFEVGDATGDLSALGQFDAIYSTEVIEHVVLPRRFAQNCFRLLKPGGIVVLSTPYHGWLKTLEIAATNQADAHYQPLEDWGHIKFWSVNTLSQLLWEAGFDEVEYRGVGRVPYLWKSVVMSARKPK
jgi:SAM-dependent methyltransferase